MRADMGRIIPFERSAEQVRRLADRRQEQGDTLAALELLLISRQRDPGDAQTCLALAETYAQMQCWTLSCDAYFALANDADLAGEAFFGLGRNYYDMRLYTLARDCLVMALQRQPEANFAPDAVEMLDEIEAAEWSPGPADVMLQRRVGRVLDALNDSRPALATRLMRRAVALDGRSSGIRALESFTRLAAGDARGALDAARRARRAEPADPRALCAMATALHALGAEDAARTYLLRACDALREGDDGHIVCDTAGEMGAHDILCGLLLRIEQSAPYAEEMLYLLAQALHNTGQREEALRRWRLLRRINPMEMLAGYYLGMSEQGQLPDELPYARGVPAEEIAARLRVVHGWVEEGKDALVARWRGDTYMEQLLRWGLSTYDPQIVSAMGGLLMSIGDRRAQAPLRDMLCDLDAPEALKHSALAALHIMGAQTPLYVVTEERLAVVDVTRASGGESDAAARAVARRAYRLLRDGGQPDREALARLSEIACRHAGRDRSLLATHAVVLAYCRARGLHVPISSTHPARRKAQRLARRIDKEAKDALHQL